MIAVLRSYLNAHTHLSSVKGKYLLKKKLISVSQKGGGCNVVSICAGAFRWQASLQSLRRRGRASAHYSRGRRRRARPPRTHDVRA